MSKYARDTSVSVDKSKSEIEAILVRYGATEFAYGSTGSSAQVGFKANDRMVRFILPLPDRNAKEFTHTPSRGRPRHSDEAFRAWEQACRQRWRALALCIKAKLEAVASGITTFEDEFLAHIMLPGGQSVGSWLRPQLASSYKAGKMPKSLLALPPGEAA